MPLPLGKVFLPRRIKSSQLVGLCGITSLVPLNLPRAEDWPTPDLTILLLGLCLESLSCAHKEIQTQMLIKLCLQQQQLEETKMAIHMSEKRLDSELLTSMEQTSNI